MNLTIHNWAAFSIVVMVVVIVWMDWVPTALNRNIQRMSVGERLPGTVIHSFVGVLFALLNIFIFKWGVLVGALWFSVVLFTAIRNWWFAYLGGIYWGEINPKVYAHYYAENVTLLPRFKQRPVIPDVQHMLIHATVLAAVVLSWASFWFAL